MSIIISLPYEATAAQEEAVRTLLDSEAMHNPNFNGADFKIERDEFSGINREGYDETALFYKIERILSGEA